MSITIENIGRIQYNGMVDLGRIASWRRLIRPTQLIDWFCLANRSYCIQFAYAEKPKGYWIRKCTPTKYSPLNFSIFQGAYSTHLPRAPNFSIINYAFATRGRVHWLLVLPYFSKTTLEYTLIDCIWHKLITNVVRLCNHVTIVYHDKLEADRPIHSIAAFGALFLARLTT